MFTPVISIVLFFILMYKARLVWHRDRGVKRMLALFWGALALAAAGVGVFAAISPKF